MLLFGRKLSSSPFPSALFFGVCGVEARGGLQYNQILMDWSLLLGGENLAVNEYEN